MNYTILIVDDDMAINDMPVSYTHLDVYKRQTVKMVTQLLFVAAIFVHIFINIRPLLCLLYTSRCV